MKSTSSWRGAPTAYCPQTTRRSPPSTRRSTASASRSNDFEVAGPLLVGRLQQLRSEARQRAWREIRGRYHGQAGEFAKQFRSALDARGARAHRRRQGPAHLRSTKRFIPETAKERLKWAESAPTRVARGEGPQSTP